MSSRLTSQALTVHGDYLLSGRCTRREIVLTAESQRISCGSDTEETNSTETLHTVVDGARHSQRSTTPQSVTAPSGSLKEAHVGLFILLLSFPSVTNPTPRELRTVNDANAATRSFSALEFIQSVAAEATVLDESDKASDVLSPMEEDILPMAQKCFLVLSSRALLEQLPLAQMMLLRRVCKGTLQSVRGHMEVYPGKEIFVHWAPSTGVDDAAPHIPKTGLLPSTWECTACGATTATSQTECSCCGWWQEPNAVRLFLGQLRRQETVQAVMWMLAMLLPHIQVLQVDNHTNPRDTSRGRGCAWIYVSRADEADVLALHKRILFDRSPDGTGEGFWLVPDTECAREQLSSYAANRLDRDLVLPRRTLVVEVATGGGKPTNGRTTTSPVTAAPAPEEGYIKATRPLYAPSQPYVPEAPVYSYGEPCQCHTCAMQGNWGYYPQYQYTHPQQWMGVSGHYVAPEAYW